MYNLMKKPWHRWVRPCSSGDGFNIQLPDYLKLPEPLKFSSESTFSTEKECLVLLEECLSNLIHGRFLDVNGNPSIEGLTFFRSEQIYVARPSEKGAQPHYFHVAHYPTLDASYLAAVRKLGKLDALYAASRSSPAVETHLPDSAIIPSKGPDRDLKPANFPSGLFMPGVTLSAKYSAAKKILVSGPPIKKGGLGQQAFVIFGDDLLGSFAKAVQCRIESFKFPVPPDPALYRPLALSLLYGYAIQGGRRTPFWDIPNGWVRSNDHAVTSFSKDGEVLTSNLPEPYATLYLLGLIVDRTGDFLTTLKPSWVHPACYQLSMNDSAPAAQIEERTFASRRLIDKENNTVYVPKALVKDFLKWFPNTIRISGDSVYRLSDKDRNLVVFWHDNLEKYLAQKDLTDDVENSYSLMLQQAATLRSLDKKLAVKRKETKEFISKMRSAAENAQFMLSMENELKQLQKSWEEAKAGIDHVERHLVGMLSPFLDFAACQKACKELITTSYMTISETSYTLFVKAQRELNIQRANLLEAGFGIRRFDVLSKARFGEVPRDQGFFCIEGWSFDLYLASRSDAPPVRPAIPTKASPRPNEIQARRVACGLDHEAAEALLYLENGTWATYENGSSKMPPAYWELFTMKSTFSEPTKPARSKVKYRMRPDDKDEAFASMFR